MIYISFSRQIYKSRQFKGKTKIDTYLHESNGKVVWNNARDIKDHHNHIKFIVLLLLLSALRIMMRYLTMNFLPS